MLASGGEPFLRASQDDADLASAISFEETPSNVPEAEKPKAPARPKWADKQLKLVPSKPCGLCKLRLAEVKCRDMDLCKPCHLGVRCHTRLLVTPEDKADDEKRFKDDFDKW